MTNFIETKEKASKELTWLISSAKVSKEYDECVEKNYTGKLPYAMVMKVLKNNTWGVVSENGKNGFNHLWIAQSENAGLTYQAKTGILTFTFYEGK